MLPLGLQPTGLQQLSMLTLDSMSQREVLTLAALTTLEELSLGWLRICMHDLQPLTALRKLLYLDLGRQERSLHNKVGDMATGVLCMLIKTIHAKVVLGMQCVEQVGCLCCQHHLPAPNS